MASKDFGIGVLSRALRHAWYREGLGRDGDLLPKRWKCTAGQRIQDTIFGTASGSTLCRADARRSSPPRVQYGPKKHLNYAAFVIATDSMSPGWAWRMAGWLLAASPPPGSCSPGWRPIWRPVRSGVSRSPTPRRRPVHNESSPRRGGAEAIAGKTAVCRAGPELGAGLVDARHAGGARQTRAPYRKTWATAPGGSAPKLELAQMETMLHEAIRSPATRRTKSRGRSTSRRSPDRYAMRRTTRAEPRTIAGPRPARSDCQPDGDPACARQSRRQRH